MRKLLLLTLALGAVACGTDPNTSEGVLEAWRKAGLEPTALEKSVDDPIGEHCKRGRVEGLSVTLCRFEDAKAAESARERGLEAIGAATGAALASGTMLLVIADRDGVDPSGRALNRVAQAYLGRAPEPAAKLPK